MLVRAAHSANIKERRDASCALFDPDGADGHAGRAHPGAPRRDAGRGRRRARRGPRAGRGLGPQRPLRGGTHLPDITVDHPGRSRTASCSASPPTAPTTPTSAARRPARCRPTRKTLEEEGVVIAPRRLDDDAIERARRADAPARPAPGRPARPARRQPHRRGAAARAARALRRRRPERRDGGDASTTPSAAPAPALRGARGRHARTPSDVLEAADGDLELRLAATVEGDSCTLDFTGTRRPARGQPQLPARGHRLGLLLRRARAHRPRHPAQRRRLPPGHGDGARGLRCSTRSPPAAVVAGNVETSSRVADLVLAAFGRALGQGTMNNLTLGNDDFTYYETLGGGQGACPDADGPSGVHVAMSNTLNTPVEALELEFPLRVVAYALRRGSGGDGRAPRRRRRGARAGGADRRWTTRCITERRRHAPARRRRRRARRAAGATCSTARRCRPKATR